MPRKGTETDLDTSTKVRRRTVFGNEMPRKGTETEIILRCVLSKLIWK